MPGYYDWKIRNCTLGAKAKADLLMQTFEEVDAYLLEIWKAGEGSFDALTAGKLAAIVEQIDTAEDALEKAKLMLAEFFPGGPQ